MLICAALLVVGGVLASAAIPPSFTAISAEVPGPEGGVESPVRVHCAVTGPPLHPDLVREE
jgi:hypothetical protein